MIELVSSTNYIKMEMILLHMLQMLEKEHPDENPLFRAPNLLLLTCNIIELLRICLYRKTIESLLTSITGSYIAEMEDETKLRAMVFEKDFEHRDSLHLLSKWNVVGIMNNKNMEKIALELWTSEYDVKGSFMTTSTTSKIVSSDSINKPRDILSDYFCLNWKYRTMENFDHHLFQFQVWKKSMKSKFLVEGLFLVIVAVALQYYLLRATKSANDVQNSYNSFVSSYSLRDLAILDPFSSTSSSSTSSSSTSSSSSSTSSSSTSAVYTKYNTFQGAAYDYYSYMQITIYLGYVGVCFAFRVLLVMLFSIKSKRDFVFLTINNILDILICTLFAVRIYFEYANYEDKLSSQSSDYGKGKQYFDNIFYVMHHGDFLDYLYCAISACVWLRIILLFRLTRFLGPLIKMLQNMIYDMCIFLVLYGTQLLVFASIGNLLFSSVDQYSSLYNALKTLFSSSLGNFDFSTLANNNKSQNLGDIFLVIFVILNNILLLNLLIAILSSTYALLEGKKVVLYINEIIKLRSSLEYNEKCSSLISTFPPWNVIAVIMSPFIMIKPNPVGANRILLHIEYIPMLILLILMYIAINILLVPLAYLKGVIIHISLLMNKRIEKTFCRKLLNFLIYLFFGLFILFFNILADSICCVLHCYQSKMSYRREKQEEQKISKESYCLLKRKFEDEHKAENKTIEYKEMVNYLRQNMQIYQHLHSIIYGQRVIQIEDEDYTILKSQGKVNEFIKIKTIVFNSSLEIGRSRIIYSNIMSQMMKELKISSRIYSLKRNYTSSKTQIENLNVNNLESWEISQYSRIFIPSLNHLNQIMKMKNPKSDINEISETIQKVIDRNIQEIKKRKEEKLNRNSSQAIEDMVHKLRSPVKALSNVSLMLKEAEQFIKN